MLANRRDRAVATSRHARRGSMVQRHGTFGSLEIPRVLGAPRRSVRAGHQTHGTWRNPALGSWCEHRRWLRRRSLAGSLPHGVSDILSFIANSEIGILPFF